MRVLSITGITKRETAFPWATNAVGSMIEKFVILYPTRTSK